MRGFYATYIYICLSHSELSTLATSVKFYSFCLSVVFVVTVVAAIMVMADFVIGSVEAPTLARRIGFLALSLTPWKKYKLLSIVLEVLLVAFFLQANNVKDDAKKPMLLATLDMGALGKPKRRQHAHKLRRLQSYVQIAAVTTARALWRQDKVTLHLPHVRPPLTKRIGVGGRLR